MTNRLANEKSPYLLQHAKNPVDWYPWGQEAFDAATSADKPVFLSIGYATCHWCHVMGKESFENVEIAQLLNENFICIKVDREEHPEVDNIYMEFAQALLGSPAGWPLNLFLTPDLKPFFAATYLPPSSKQGMIGFPQIIEQIKVLWNGEERHMITQQAEKVVETFAHTSNATGQELPSAQDMTTGAERFFESADPVNGGLKGEPKFPLSYQGEFLLGYAKKSGDGRALFYVELTFEMMRRGGIYDQIGGGFSRYSVDERWEIPHFEKMLYDNATLITAYLQAWKYTKKEAYATVCRETCNYLLRDLKHMEGGFYSGEDADSGGYEGLYYTWTPMEVEEVIQGDDFDLCSALFDITHAGNFDGRNVLHLETSEEEFAESFNIDATQLPAKISQWKKALLRRRDTRPRPMRDEKILVSWNGLAIDALVRCGMALDEPTFLQAAVESATFLRNQLWSEVEGRLLHRWCKGEAKFGALLDDYAFLIKALLTLYEQGCGEQWLEWAVRMAKIVERDFKEIEGAFYQTDGRDPLVLRKCEFYDGAEPSGNAVHAENLLRLHQITQDESYLRQAEDILKASRNYIAKFAPGASYHLLALQRLLDASAPTVIVSLDKEESLKKEISKALATHFCPTLTVIWKREKDLIDGKTTLYLCRQNKCEASLTKFSEIVKVIETL